VSLGLDNTLAQNESKGALRMRWFSRACSGLLLVFVGAQLLALSSHLADQRYLSVLADSIANSALSPSEQAQNISRFLRDKSSETNAHYFAFPILRFLRATPRQVAEYGGDCADRSRLMVVLLDLHGIRSSKWALYSSEGQPRHAVVELNAESGKMVMDGLFGLSFPKPGGGYYGIADLRENPDTLRSRIATLESQGQRPGTDRLEGYPQTLYVYGYARTINWDKSAFLLLMYRGLHSLFGPRVDTIYRPVVVEQPALMVIWGLAGLEGGILICWFVASRFSMKQKTNPEEMMRR
jgi:hypothetical protein